MINRHTQMHIALSQGEVGRYCLLPGDPGRCEKIAAYLENPVKLAQNREFTSYSGTLLGEKITVCSTGIGGPSAAIAVEELFACGCDTFIRIGSCGGIKESVMGGDVVVATAAVRQEGTTKEYVPPEFPAVADLDVTLALRQGARSCGFNVHHGIVQSKDSFYGQHAPHRMPIFYQLENQWEAWGRAGVLASEMEGAAVFCVSSVLGCRAGAVFSVYWNQNRAAKGLPNPIDETTDRAVRTAIEGLKILIENDRGEKK